MLIQGACEEHRARTRAAPNGLARQPRRWILLEQKSAEPGVGCTRRLGAVHLERYAADTNSFFSAFCFGGRAGVPASMPIALISSSTSGQWIPCPLPMISKWFRSSGVALDKRHDQAHGTLIVRPSASRAVIVSSLTTTSMIRGSLPTTMFIPRLQDFVSMIENQFPIRPAMRGSG
jgi:hypothetical protein